MDHSCFSPCFSAGFCSSRNLPLASLFGPRTHTEQYQHRYPAPLGRHFYICDSLCSYKAEDACKTHGDLPRSLRPQQVARHTCSSAAAGPPIPWSSVKSSFPSMNHTAHHSPSHPARILCPLYQNTAGWRELRSPHNAGPQA